MEVLSIFRRRKQSAQDPELIKKKLTDLRESHMEKDETMTKAAEIPRGVPEENHRKIRAMLEKKEKMCLG